VDGSDGREICSNRPVPKYIIFFDVNVPKRRLIKHLSPLRGNAKLVFLGNRKNIFEKGKILNRMKDPELLNYAIKLSDLYFPSLICFFFTLDTKILRDISIKHPARERMFIEIFRQHSRSEIEILAAEMIKRFEDRVKNSGAT